MQSMLADAINGTESAEATRYETDGLAIDSALEISSRPISTPTTCAPASANALQKKPVPQPLENNPALPTENQKPAENHPGRRQEDDLDPAEVKARAGANSGFYFHTAYQEKDWPAQGFEVQVNNSQKQHGDYLELKKTGSLYGIRNVYRALAPDDERMQFNLGYALNAAVQAELPRLGSVLVKGSRFMRMERVVKFVFGDDPCY